MTATLTKGRRAVWDAINGRAELRANGQSVFKQQLRFDEESPLIEADSIEEWLSPADLPTIAIWSRQVQMSWNRNTAQEWFLTLLIQMWTIDHKLPRAEEWAEQVVLAAHETGGNVSFVKQATGHHPVGAGDFTFDPVLIGETEDDEDAVKAIRTTFNLRLRFIKAVD